jgi:hypothetical protein
VRAAFLAIVIGCAPATPPVQPERAPAVPVEIALTGRLGRYAGRFDIGGESFGLAIDTGSELIAVAGAGCPTCDADGSTAYYQPGPKVKRLGGNVVSKYDEGQLGWSGDAYLDRVSADGLGAPVVVFAMTDETDMVLIGEDIVHADGILGLAGSGETSWLDALARTGVRDELAIHKCETTGTLWLAGAPETGPATFVDATDDYAVALHSVAVGSAHVELPPNTEAIVDSGAPGLVVPRAAYDAITAELDRNMYFAGLFGSGATWFGSDNCVPNPLPKLLDRLPPVTIELDGLTMTIPATQSYALPWPPDKVCPGLRTREDFVSIGDVAMRAGTVIFDRAAHRIGFAPATACND